VSQDRDLRNLYAQFGNELRAKFLGWQVAMLSNRAQLLGQVGLNFDQSISLVNGGLKVRLMKGTVIGTPWPRQ
jgi:23S rRNA G2445 N2-methylase RlmL